MFGFGKKKKTKAAVLLPDPEKVPKHVAFILDGNGRWAAKRNLPRNAGHKKGAEVFEEITDNCKDAGVKTTMDYAIFQNYGYQGLYGGLKAKDIHERKGLQKNQHILDHMDYEELAANLFRATQTEAKLRRDKVEQKAAANQTHYEVGKKVRQTIADLGGTMPEDLPVPEKSIKQIEKEQKQLQST